MASEKIFTLKKGTEVAERFDGVTIPYTVPTSMTELVERAGGEQNAIAIFNQAFALNLQKAVKASALDDDATVDSLRAIASSYKPGEVRVRGPGSGRPKATAAAATALADLGIELTPEQRAAFEAKMAQLTSKKKAENGAATPAATNEAPATPRKASAKK
jgi:hypothetical protein